MTKVLLITCFSGLLFGCSSGKNRYEAEWKQTRDWAIANLVGINCGANKSKLGNCDAVSEQFYSEMPTLIKENCGGKMTNKCAKDMINVLFARYQLRYKYADWAQAKLSCDANPRGCGFDHWLKAENFELKLAKTHNEKVHEIAMASKDEIQSRADLAALERKKAYLDAIQGMQQRSPTNVRCTSTTVGSVTNTNCN